jgi:hypothetical protein
MAAAPEAATAPEAAGAPEVASLAANLASLEKNFAWLKSVVEAHALRLD